MKFIKCFNEILNNLLTSLFHVRNTEKQKVRSKRLLHMDTQYVEHITQRVEEVKEI